MSSLGGSLICENVEDYYFTPWELDYGRHTKFDHDFIGREALEKMAHKAHRKKVTLVWDSEDVLKVFAGMMEAGEMPKFMDFPAAYYSGFPFDRVLSSGKDIGVSISPAYSANERAWLSLAIVNQEFATTGTQLTVIWGEPDAREKGAGVKPNVERHRQIAIGATVHPWPINEATRTNYRSRK